MSVFIGFDYGTKRIGVAVGDSLTRNAKPLTTIAPDWHQVDSIIKEWNPSACIVGLPLTESGEHQKATRRALDFARTLASKTRLPVHTEDERHTTVAAESSMKEHAQHSREKRKKTSSAGLDAVAASIILEQWLRKQPVEHKIN